MGAAATTAEISFHSARNYARAGLTVPVQLTILRGVAPEPVPARAVNVSEGGLYTVVAAELRPHELVGLEFRLPDVGIPVKAKAWVRHQSALRCGLEFTGLSYQQRAMIRYWLQRLNESERKAAPVLTLPLPKPQVKSHKPILGVFTVLSFICVLCMMGLGWWYWQSEWDRIERHLPLVHKSAEEYLVVPAEEVQKRLIHQVDPIYPEAARSSNLAGVVQLKVVIGADGAVLHVTPVSGPEIFQSAAVDAVKWWRFQPYLSNGQAVPVETTLGVAFRP